MTFFFDNNLSPRLVDVGWVEAVVKRWVEIRRWAADHQRPFVAGIPERGRIRML